jgi:hypothetical protein
VGTDRGGGSFALGWGVALVALTALSSPRSISDNNVMAGCGEESVEPNIQERFGAECLRGLREGLL